LHLQAQVPFGPTWVIARVIIKTLNLAVKQCVLNHIKEYWLLSDVFYVAISN
jgi:hypothetical protein